ncbi:MAG TPA: hypothetical protein VGB24_02715 [Longimicrobium sp.]|uniref:hypothetical protein n=1 Tax=Longimicrobium sp. TaxID=2029185 RepID=UPI002ED96484
MRIRSVLGLLLFCVLPSALRAQGNCPTLAAGSLVRLHSGTEGTYRLPLPVQPTDTAIVIPASGEIVRPPVRCGDLRRVELRVGPGSRVRSGLTGAGVGALMGGIVGAALGYADWRGSSDFQLFSRQESMALGAVLIGGVGAVTGGVIGVVAPGSRWENVPLRSGPARTSAGGLRIAPAGRSQVRVSYTLPL